MGNKSGFTLIESLFSLMVSGVVIILCLGGFALIHQSKAIPKITKEIDIMFKQIQNECIEATDFSTDGTQLCYQKDNQSFVLSLDQQRLVKKEGYEIFLYDVEAVAFEINDFIYLTIIQNGESERRIIGVHRTTYD